jgi:lipase chaperone LimK
MGKFPSPRRQQRRAHNGRQGGGHVRQLDETRAEFAAEFAAYVAEQSSEPLAEQGFRRYTLAELRAVNR